MWCGVVWCGALTQMNEYVHILVLYRMYAGDGEQRPLTDPPGDVISMSAIYVVTGSKGITVRDGMEATSQEILVLHPGELKVERNMPRVTNRVMVCLRDSEIYRLTD